MIIMWYWVSKWPSFLAQGTAVINSPYMGHLVFKFQEIKDYFIVIFMLAMAR